MSPEPRPDDPAIPRARKILEDYSDRISGINAPPALPRTGAAEKDALELLAEKLAAFDPGTASKPDGKRDLFPDIRGKIDSELAAAPARRTSPPVAPAPVKNTPRFPAGLALGALALLLAAALALLPRWQTAEAAYRRSHAALSSNISALVWNGNDLWAGDWVSGSVYRYSRKAGKLELIAQYPLEGSHITSLAIADDKLYVWDSWKKAMEIRDLDADLTLRQTVPIPDKITTIAYDGRHLWACDDTGTVSVRASEDGLPRTSAHKLAGKPDQIYWGDKHLWAAASSTGRLYRHRLEPGFPLEKTYIIKDMDTEHPLSAFTWQDGKLWFAMDGKAEITELGKANLEETR